ncbi:hypothetical protein KUCAC02_016840 [Chaenocephalus aceratus]|nr:hypothetical protein KUCAC02_016840 [Chaenocephalus aceratus]
MYHLSLLLRSQARAPSSPLRNRVVFNTPRTTRGTFSNNQVALSCESSLHSTRYTKLHAAAVSSTCSRQKCLSRVSQTSDTQLLKSTSLLFTLSTLCIFDFGSI